jgi:hypothetical protein
MFRERRIEMIATNFEITDRKKADPVSFADIKDFELRESGERGAEEILNNQDITLYSLEFQSGQAVFVETPPEINLSQTPFFYQAQREHAVRVLTVPFETMIQLAHCITADDKKLIHIYSMGRSGSTLASKILAQVEGVVNISEPDTLTQLVAARFMQPDKEMELKALLDASIRLLCKTPAPTAWVIKGRSWMVELGDWLHELYPNTKNIFLYREAQSWIKSNLGAFLDKDEWTAEQQIQFENETRSWMRLFVPLIARYDPDTHLSLTGLSTLMWLSLMERYTELDQSGVKMLAIQYASWQQAPHQTALAMLDYCGCRPSDLTVVEETLQKDSQAGTSIAQEAVKRKGISAGLLDTAEMNRFLQAHAYINSPNFEVHHTLKL